MYDRATKMRFKSNVIVDRKSGCWLWIGSRHPRGYGRFWARGRNVYTHRYLYPLAKGPIPPGLELDHLCGNKHCCNPNHLEAVTHGENMRRAAQEGVWSGQRNGNAKRTDQQVLAIRILSHLDIPASDISSMLAVPERSVYYVLNEGWNHV